MFGTESSKGLPDGSLGRLNRLLARTVVAADSVLPALPSYDFIAYGRALPGRLSADLRRVRPFQGAVGRESGFNNRSGFVAMGLFIR
jgi:hypothetical protein